VDFLRIFSGFGRLFSQKPIFAVLAFSGPGAILPG
jgi:hypothetical protein